MKCPPGGLQACKEYHNFMNFYSTVLMAMVDSHYRFVWGSCGFPGNSQQRNFKYSLSRARMVTEGAYGQLKGRWRVLLRKSESSQDNVRITTLACMVLHNTCIARKCFTIAIKTIQLSSHITQHDEFIRATFSSEIFFETNNIFATRGKNLFLFHYVREDKKLNRVK